MLRAAHPAPPIPPPLSLRLCSLEPITQRHQFIHLGNDAVLFGEGREEHREQAQSLHTEPLPRNAHLDVVDDLLKEGRYQRQMNELTDCWKKETYDGDML